MKKKLSKISVLLVLMLTLALCFTFGASAEETTYTEGNYTYTVTDEKATITAVDTAISGDITTPATLGGYPVTVIGKQAFQHCSDITSVVVSEGVEVIELDAFYDCSALESATLPESLTTLGSSPFMFTNMKELAIPKNVSDIGAGAFLGVFTDKIVVDEENPYYSTDEYGVLFNEDKTTLIAWPALCSEVNYTVPETVKIINFGAFSYAPRLEAVTLPEGLEEIGEAAFCLSSIKSVNIPASVKTIHERAFESAFDLEEIIVDEDNTYFSSEDGVLFNKDKTSLLYYPEGKTDRTYVVPETVSKVNGDLYGALFLRKLTFQNNFEISSNGITVNDLLTDIVFEENVTKIPETAFTSYGFKKNVYIKGMNVEMPGHMSNYFETRFVAHGGDPDTIAEGTKEMYKKIYGTPVSEAEASAYQDEWDSKYGFEYLDDYVVNAEIICHSDSTAAAYAQENGIPYRTKCFFGEPDSEGTMKCINCDGTRSYYHDENEAFENGFIYVVYKGEAIILEAGYNNDDFAGYVEIPETLGGYPVTTLPEYLFQNDSYITGVFIPASVTSIGQGAFMNCGDLISITVDKNNPAYTSVEGVLYDKDKKVLVAYPAGNPRTSYTVPDDVVSIAPVAFSYSCTLENVALPDSLKVIGRSAFYYCTALTEIKIPKGVTTIPESAFSDCRSLVSAEIPEGVTSIGEYAFSVCSNLEDVTIPDSVISIGEHAFEKPMVENNPNYSVDEYGVIFNKDKTTLIKYPAESTNTSYTIPDSVTRIEKNAFSYASNLTEIIVSDNIISIGSGILYGTGYYNDTANWEDGYLYLGKYLIGTDSTITEFAPKEGTLVIACGINNSDITSIVIPDSVVAITGEAFNCNSYLTSVTFGSGLKIIEDRAFANCNSLTTVKNLDSVTDIGEGAFECCPITEITFGNSLKTIGDSAFSNNDVITSIAIPDSVVSIGEGAFAGCDNLAEITMSGENLQHLGSGAFSYAAYTYDSNNWKDGVCTIGNAIVACDIGTVKVDENIKFIVDENAYWMPMSFDVDENNPYFSSDETGSLYNKDKTKLIRYNGFCKNESYVIPETVKEIGEYAFSYSMYLKELTIPDSVEIIGEGAFEAVISLENIYFQPDNLYLEDSYLGICGELALVEDEAALWEEYWNIVGLSLKFERGEFIPTEEEMAEFESRIAYIEENMVSNRWDFAQSTIHCHEGSLTDIYALSYGVNVEYTHIFKNWTYDWEGLERTAKCLYCDETTTESLRSEEDNEIEFIAPADEETTFVVETVEDAESDDYILVTEALEAVEGPAEIEKIYDITLETSEGVAVQPDGSVQVKLPVEESHGNYKVFRVNDDGTYTDMNATVVDGYVVFVTDHFSLYVVVDTTEKTCEHEFDYAKSEANLTRPRQVDGTWVDGYYTYTCSLCGETETEVAKRADYTEYYVVETRFAGILLNEDIDVNIRYKLLEELQATEVEFTDDFIESEQQTLNRFTDYLLACTERAEVCVEGTHYFTKYEEVTAPKCGVAGLEKSVCDYCGAEDEKEIPALKHVPLAAVKEKEVAPTCEAAGSYDSVVYCDLCGEEISRETVTVSAKGHSKVTVPGKAATCKETGLTDGVKCSVCGKTLTAQKTIAKADHKDKNGDYKCDYGCGHEFERPTPDKCDHMCHQSGFMGFIWKIVQFFWKLFKMNPVCECGAAHY